MITADLCGANLGDALWLTPLAKRCDLTVRMCAGDKRSALTAPIFDGLAKVEFVDRPGDTLKTQSRKHVTQCILEAYGFSGSSIPEVKLTPGEIDWAKGYLSAYPKPLAFVNGNSANGTNPRAEYVRPPVAALNALVAHYTGRGYTCLQFGPAADFYDKDMFEPLIGTVAIRGLNVRQLAACYHVIGKLISGDTGDYHLMLAVKGVTVTLVPHHSDSFGYRHYDLLYDSDCWGPETPRCAYLHHSDWELAKGVFV